MSGTVKISVCPHCQRWHVPKFRIHRQVSYFCDPEVGGCGAWGPWRTRDKVDIKRRLAYLRGEIEAERISYGEIAELQALAKYIEPGDVLLLQWAGVAEEKTT